MGIGFSVTNSRGVEYYLHSKAVELKNTGRAQTIYFFSKKAVDAIEMPEGYEVVENSRSGLPFLRKAK